MAKRRGLPGWGVLQWARHFFAVCAWACALFVAVGADAHADVDTSTGLGDNTLTNSGKFHVTVYIHTQSGNGIDPENN